MSDANPTEPTEPVNPTEPVAPTEPTEPVNPVEPSSAWDNYGVEIPVEYKPLTDKYSGGIVDALKALKNAQSVIGQKGLSMPADDASDADWDAWHKHCGRPDDVSGYEVNIPDDIASSVDEDYIEKAKELAHKIGLTPKQLQAMADFRFQEFTNTQEALRDYALRSSEEANIALGKEWGEDKDSFVNEIHEVLKEQKIYDKFARSGLLNDADGMKFLHALVGGMNEGGVPSKTQIATVDSQLKALYSSESYLNTGHKDHMETMKRIAELNKIKARSM